jgi:hypothetical protein
VLLPRPRSRCGCAPRPASRDDKRTARSVSRVRGVVVGYATPRPPAERLQVACSGWEGMPHRCPRSHTSPGRISAPHRQQWTTPASTWVDHWRRSARWVAPYRSPRWALRLRSLLRRQLSQRVAVVSVSPHSRQGRSMVVHLCPLVPTVVFIPQSCGTCNGTSHRYPFLRPHAIATPW